MLRHLLFFLLSAFILIPLFSTFLVSCNKEDDLIGTDTLTLGGNDTLLPPHPDTITTFSDSLRKVDVYFFDGLTGYTGYQGSYFFEYDNKKRVTGIKENFNTFKREDSIIYSFEYTGNSSYPSKCIFYEKLTVLAGVYAYDTMYYEYDNVDRLIKDSVNIDLWGADPFDKRKNIRQYTYTGNNSILIKWSAFSDLNNAWATYRKDSIEIDINRNCKNWLTFINTDGSIHEVGTFATKKTLAQVLNYSSLKNPFADLNTAGFPGFWLEKHARYKVLGNRFYLAIHNSNMLPVFLDQGSPYLISDYVYHNWNEGGIGIGINTMGITTTTDPHRLNYPSKYTVAGTLSVANDKYEYRFTYR